MLVEDVCAGARVE